MTYTGGMPGYTASKAAMHGLSRGLARDFGPARIRVNTLVPGWVMPEDIARMTLFLAADDSAMITAQSFVVDGGWV